eukprot:TRINITY_DN24049_c0_g1_i1.p1 TRINITY_DN24049_c0_g1~~TRINITY_DN24049_c0_g1_i1.p1  ORF type:complete len:104 (-),score=0.86 TRINITY_DN24049_c0_g1_i1:380-691(-)
MNEFRDIPQKNYQMVVMHKNIFKIPLPFHFLHHNQRQRRRRKKKQARSLSRLIHFHAIYFSSSSSNPNFFVIFTWILPCESETPFAMIAAPAKSKLGPLSSLS